MVHKRTAGSDKVGFSIRKGSKKVPKNRYIHKHPFAIIIIFLTSVLTAEEQDDCIASVNMIPLKTQQLGSGNPVIFLGQISKQPCDSFSLKHGSLSCFAYVMSPLHHGRNAIIIWLTPKFIFSPVATNAAI